jgi:hypothetical protein
VQRLLILACCVALTTGATLPVDPRAKDAVGELHVLVIRATWGPSPAATGDLAGAAAFYERASFGKLRLQIDVTPWLRAYDAPLCPGDATERSVFGRLGELAQAAAAGAGYDVGSYGRIAYILPERMCSPAALGVGREVFLASDAGLLDDLAFVHELGHTFGLPHATRSRCARGCRIVEYGDPLSPMGAGGTDFSALEKLELGWISSVQRVDRSGTYAVAAVDASSSLPQALVVPTAVGEYWVERRATGLVVRLVRPNDPAHPVYLRSIFLARSEGRYVARDVFSVTRQFAFSWLDKKRPSVPRARALDHAYLSWTRSADRDSGIAEYRVTVDRRPLATTTDTGIALPPLSEGGHRITVVAVDRAGNRSRPGVVSLNV